MSCYAEFQIYIHACSLRHNTHNYKPLNDGGIFAKLSRNICHTDR